MFSDSGSGVASPKYLGEPNLLTISEQQYFVWDTASQSTKLQCMLNICGDHTPSGYACTIVVVFGKEMR